VRASISLTRGENRVSHWLRATNYLLLLLSGFDLFRLYLWPDGSIAIEEAGKMLQ
jgi:hypothetical protein